MEMYFIPENIYQDFKKEECKNSDYMSVDEYNAIIFKLTEDN